MVAKLIDADSAGLEQLDQGLRAIDLDLSNVQRQQLLAYMELLKRWNRAYNLVSPSDMPQLLSRHLLDSLAIHPFIAKPQDADGKQLVDVGSGAGFPGLALAIAFPELGVTLIDSNGKKTRFLFAAKTELGLANVSVENCRVEHYKCQQQIDIVTCRAFSALANFVLQCRHLLNRDTRLLAMKGRDPAAEISQLPADIQVPATHELAVPGIDAPRHLLELRCQQ